MSRVMTVRKGGASAPPERAAASGALAPEANLRVAFAVLALLFAAQPAAAQQPQQPGNKGSPVSKVVRLNRAPVSKDVLRVTLPKPYETRLPNGLRVLVLEDHRFPLVTVSLLILGAGATAEPADLPGLASATAVMLDEGTTSRNSKQIAEETEKLGAQIGFFAPFGGTTATMSASGLSDNFNQWFALAVDELLHPAFPAEELAKWKQRAAVRLKQQRSSPQFLLRERYSLAVYCGNPDDRSTCLPEARVSETPASIEAMTPERLTSWHDARYVPQNAILAVAGDVETKALVGKLTRDLAAWKRTDLADQPPPATHPVAERRVYLVDRPNSVQTTVWLGNIAIDRRDADYVPVVVANRVFGGGPSARLFLNLREEKGYTYGVYSNFTAVRYAGPWAASGDVTRDVTEGAMKEFLYEFTRLGKEPVPESELDDARRAVVAGFALSLEQPDRLMGYALDGAIYSLPADYWDTYPAKITAITAADVTRVAAKYLDPAKLQIVAVGEAKSVLPAFGKYGAVNVYDTQGKLEAISQIVTKGPLAAKYPPASGGAGSGPSGQPANAAETAVAAVGATAEATGAGAALANANDSVHSRCGAQTVAVSPAVQIDKLLNDVRPHYPEHARRKGVSGTVRLRACISKDGLIQQLEVVSGPKELIKAAMEAVRQWRFQPTLVNEEPVGVETYFDVIFTLGG